jgi:pimeloyl-ACP methyl ester carboxylesterase
LQNFEISKSMGVDEKLAKATSLRQNEIYRFMNEYQGSEFKSDLVRFLRDKMKDPQAEANAAQFSSPWFRYFVRFDPGLYLKAVKVPVLALNGTKDLQVTAPENLAGIRKSLPPNRKTEILAMEGMNHLFQTAKTGSVQEYAQIEETISPMVLEKIAAWIKGIF